MATFGELTSVNRRNSVLLVIGFIVFICGLGALLGWGIWGTWQAAIPSIAIALAVSGVMALMGYYSGPKAVLSMSGAREIDKSDDPQLFNIIDELRLASGLPMPKVYLIPTDAMNAFATGRDPEHAHVAVTQGLRRRLNRDELQGVVAHELSHVKNLDIRFMTLMAVLVGTTVLLADIGLRSLWFSRGGRRRGNSGGAGIIFLIIAIVLAILAPILAKLIQMAVSRQREFLADADAAHMTRYPEGLASALEKLGGDKTPMRQASRGTAHLFIVQPMMARAGGRRRPAGTKRHSWWSSHPSVEERVERLRSIGDIA